MATPRILAIIAVQERLAEYTQIPEGILRLKKYLDKKNVGMDVAACDTGLDADHPHGKWFWLSESGRVREEITVLDFSQYDLVSITVLSNILATAVNHFEAFLKTLRKRAGNIPFVAGGFGVWGYEAEMATAYKDLDFIVHKWGEVPLEFLAKKCWLYHIKHPIREKEFRYIAGKKRASKKRLFFSNSKKDAPNGIFVRYHNEGTVVVYGSGAYEDIPKSALYYHHEKKKLLEISTQLGCKYGRCDFCVWRKHTRWKQLSVKWVLRSIEEAQPLEVEIFDACFLYPGCKESVRILEGIKNLIDLGKIGQDIALFYEARADAFARDTVKCNELIRIMKTAKTKKVFIGFESGSPSVLKQFKKGATVEQNVYAIDCLANAGITIGGYFILSSPQSTLVDVIKTFELITYLAKQDNEFLLQTNPAVLRFSEEPLCIKKEDQLRSNYTYPADKIAAHIVKIAHENFDRLKGYVFKGGRSNEVTNLLKLINCMVLDCLENTQKNGKPHTQMEAAAAENAKFEKMLETDDRNELRKLLLEK